MSVRFSPYLFSAGKWEIRKLEEDGFNFRCHGPHPRTLCNGVMEGKSDVFFALSASEDEDDCEGDDAGDLDSTIVHSRTEHSQSEQCPGMGRTVSLARAHIS